MYSAIVFLPLIGAIIGGIVALYGAWLRTSGAETEAPHRDRGSHGHAHGHDAEDEHDHDDGHDDHEPAALGSRAVEIVTSGFLIVSAILSWIAFFSVGFGDGAGRARAGLHLDELGDARRRLGAPDRHADGR